jgi:hypothetical protein
VNAWGLAILAAGILFVLLGVTGKADGVLNGARTKSGAPTKNYS